MKFNSGWPRRRLFARIAVSLVIFTGCAGATTRAQVTSTAVEEPAGVIPDTGGPIAELVLHFLTASAADLAPTYADLFEALPPDVNLQVLCPSATDVHEFWARWGPAATAGGRSVRVVNLNRPITIWPRDRRIARQSAFSGHPATTIVPASVPDYTEDKRGELTVPRFLAATGALPAARTIELHIEGGNIVSNRRHAFVGANVYDENADALADRSAVDRALRDLLGRPYLALSDGADQVPWCHVDMYVTPVDDTTVLVASPTMALPLLTLDRCDPDEDDADELAPDFTDDLLTGSTTLDVIATQLARSGYHVRQLPALIDPDEEWMITYNNVLMERRDGKRIVYMPVYHLPALDSLAASIYRSLGFEVRTIDVTGIYRVGGAIRCAANVTARRASPRSVSASTSNATAGFHSERSAPLKFGPQCSGPGASPGRPR